MRGLLWSRWGVRMVAADRSVALRLGCAAIIAAAIPATSAELKDPLSPLTSARGSILCFRRVLLCRASHAAPDADDRIRAAGLSGAGLGYDRPEPAHWNAEPDTGRVRVA